MSDPFHCGPVHFLTIVFCWETLFAPAPLKKHQRPWARMMCYSIINVVYHVLFNHTKYYTMYHLIIPCIIPCTIQCIIARTIQCIIARDREQKMHLNEKVFLYFPLQTIHIYIYIYIYIFTFFLYIYIYIYIFKNIKRDLGTIQLSKLISNRLCVCIDFVPKCPTGCVDKI